MVGRVEASIVDEQYTDPEGENRAQGRKSLGVNSGAKAETHGSIFHFDAVRTCVIQVRKISCYSGISEKACYAYDPARPRTVPCSWNASDDSIVGSTLYHWNRMFCKRWDYGLSYTYLDSYCVLSREYVYLLYHNMGASNAVILSYYVRYCTCTPLELDNGSA